MPPISATLPYITTGALVVMTSAYGLYKYCKRPTASETQPLTDRATLGAPASLQTPEITELDDLIVPMSPLAVLRNLDEAIFSEPINMTYVACYVQEIIGKEDAVAFLQEIGFDGTKKSLIQFLSNEASSYVASAHQFTVEQWDRLDYFCWEACGKADSPEFGKHHRLDKGLNIFLDQVQKVLDNA
jgi:hypothetical protein